MLLFYVFLAYQTENLKEFYTLLVRTHKRCDDDVVFESLTPTFIITPSEYLDSLQIIHSISARDHKKRSCFCIKDLRSP